MQSKIASLPASSGGNYDDDIDNLYAEIESIREELDTTLLTVEDMLAKWEEEQVTTNEEQSNTTTRWGIECSSSYSSSEIKIDWYSSPSRIEEADIYKIRLTIYNSKVDAIGNPVEIKDLYIDIDLTPNSGDEVFVNGKNTYLDTIQSPYYWWDMDVVTRGENEYTRRISFVSEKITAPAATSITKEDGTVEITPSEIILTLELELEYQ